MYDTIHIVTDKPRPDLLEALDAPIFVDIALPIEERRYQTRVVATLKDAARRMANLNKVEATGQPLCSHCGRGPSDFDYWIDPPRDPS